MCMITNKVASYFANILPIRAVAISLIENQLSSKLCSVRVYLS